MLRSGKGHSKSTCWPFGVCGFTFSDPLSTVLVESGVQRLIVRHRDSPALGRFGAMSIEFGLRGQVRGELCRSSTPRSLPGLSVPEASSERWFTDRAGAAPSSRPPPRPPAPRTARPPACASRGDDRPGHPTAPCPAPPPCGDRPRASPRASPRRRTPTGPAAPPALVKYLDARPSPPPQPAARTAAPTARSSHARLTHAARSLQTARVRVALCVAREEPRRAWAPPRVCAPPGLGVGGELGVARRPDRVARARAPPQRPRHSGPFVAALRADSWGGGRAIAPQVAWRGRRIPRSERESSASHAARESEAARLGAAFGRRSGDPLGRRSARAPPGRLLARPSPRSIGCGAPARARCSRRLPGGGQGGGAGAGSVAGRRQDVEALGVERGAVPLGGEGPQRSSQGGVVKVPHAARCIACSTLAPGPLAAVAQTRNVFLVRGAPGICMDMLVIASVFVLCSFPCGSLETDPGT